MNRELRRQATAEGLGTFFLVFSGCGSETAAPVAEDERTTSGV